MSERIAKTIADRLKNAGFQALFAGGWVRDRLLGIESNDIDIATDATPEEVARLYPKAILVGAQFGVVRVIEQGHEFEIATFRIDDGYHNGRTPDSIQLVSSSREDALRRDFTINGMFYDPFTQEIIDYVGGQEDLQKNIIRAIGNPKDRFREDRLRMIRAIRFATTFNATIEDATWKAIGEFAQSLRPAVSPERIWQELNKIYITQDPKKLAQSFALFHKTGLLTEIFPHLKNNIDEKITRLSLVPQGTPLPLVLGLLITQDDSIKREECLRAFHTSNNDIQMVVFEDRLEKALQDPHDDAFWVDFYAHPLFEATLNTLTTDSSLILQHSARKEELIPWVLRKQTKTPIVSATDLTNLGYRPGKELGMLLHSAEIIAINERLHTKEEVLKKLL